jgi:hypothetical protein
LINASYGAWKNHISHGNCYGLKEKMDKKIRTLEKKDGKGTSET